MAALVKLPQLTQAVANDSDGHFVERSRSLLAIARDEGNRSAVVEKTGRSTDLARRVSKFSRDLFEVLV